MTSDPDLALEEGGNARMKPMGQQHSLDRRSFVVAALAAAGGLVSRLSVVAQETAESASAPDLMTADTEKAIREGLAFLASHQEADGSFGADGYRRNVAVVSLAGLAFLANGSALGRGPFGRNVSQCLEYILDAYR